MTTIEDGKVGQTLQEFDNRELFICLGKYDHVIFFMHIQRNDMSEDTMFSMSGDVYNMLIQEKRIKHDDNVLVFNFCDGYISPVNVCHETFKVMNYKRQDLEIVIDKLLCMKREGKTIAIAGEVENYRPVKYLLYEFEFNFPGGSKSMKTMLKKDHKSMPLGPVVFYKSMKPLMS